MFCNRDLLKLCFLSYRWPKRNQLYNMLRNQSLFNIILHVDRTIKLKLSLRGHKKVVTSLLSLKDNNIASGSLDTTIRIWDYKNNYKCLKVLQGHKSKIICMVQLLNGDIASGSADQTIKIWGYRRDNTCLHTIEEDLVTRLQILPEGYLVSAATSIKIWDKENSYKLLGEIKDRLLNDILVPKSGDIISASNELLRIYSNTDYQCTNIVEGHRFQIVFVIELSDSNIASASLDRSIKIWNNGNNVYSCIRTLYWFDHLISMTPLSNGKVIVGTHQIMLLDCNSNIGHLKIIKENTTPGHIVVQLNNEDIIFGECKDINLWGI
jgi:WD40 repeat protein